MSKTVAEKMGLKKNAQIILVNVPDDAVAALHLPEVEESKTLSGKFDHLLFFVTSQVEMDKKFPLLKKHLKPTGTLWVCWPKNKQLETDLTLTLIIKIGYDHGLVESKTLSINSTWSAIKFTHPKAGKTYNNSYGKLKA